MCFAALAIAGTALQVGGQIASASAASADAGLKEQIYKSNAQVSETTSKTQKLLAELPVMQARLDEARLRDEVAGTLASEKAGYAAAGLDPASGSPLLIQGITAAQGEVDAGLVRVQGQLNRAAALANSASTDSETATDLFQAAGANIEQKSAMVAGLLGAGTALISGFRSIGGSFGTGSPVIVPSSSRGAFGLGPSVVTVPQVSGFPG